MTSGNPCTSGMPYGKKKRSLPADASIPIETGVQQHSDEPGELRPHLTQTQTPKQANCIASPRRTVQPRTSERYCLGSRQIYATIRYDRRVRDTCRCKSRQGMTSIREKSATSTLFMTTAI